MVDSMKRIWLALLLVSLSVNCASAQTFQGRSTSPVRAAEFGTVGDGTIGLLNGNTTGTDNTAAIQSAIDFALQNNFETVCLNDGTYLTTDTIQLGWGEAHHSIVLQACNQGRSPVFPTSTFMGGVTVGPGVSIILDQAKVDRCAINIQGGNEVAIRNITFVGQNYGYNLFVPTTIPWPATASGWLNPTLVPSGSNPGGLQQHSPYSGICVDAYAATASTSNAALPTDHYPVVPFPAWTGLSAILGTAAVNAAGSGFVGASGTMTWAGSGCSINPVLNVTASGGITGVTSIATAGICSPLPSSAATTWTPGGGLSVGTGASFTVSNQYGKVVTTDIELTDVSVHGFAVGINSKPNGANSGDFLKILRMQCTYNTYCISVGNEQSRNVHVEDLSYAGVFAALTNNTFGDLAGKLGGPLMNFSGGKSYETFKIGALGGFGFPITISDSYYEGQVRFGEFAGSASTYNQSITLDGCDANSLNYFTGVIPVSVIKVTGAPMNFTLKDCSFGSGDRIDNLIWGPANVTISGGTFIGGAMLGSLFNNAGIQRANNYTGSALVGGAATFPNYVASTPSTSTGKLVWLNPTQGTYMPLASSAAAASQQIGPDADFATYGARAQFTQATTGFVDTLNKRQWKFAAGPSGGTVDLSSGTYTSVAAAFTSCDVVTFTYLAAVQAAQATSLTVGDVILYNDGTIFVVTAAAAADGMGNFPFTTRQMNNMQVNGSSACTVSLVSQTLTGLSQIIHTGVLIPQKVFFGDFTSSMTAVANISPGNGVATDLDTYVKANDLMWNYTQGDTYFQWPYANAGKMSTVTNGSPGTATLSANSTLTGRFPLLPLPVAR